MKKLLKRSAISANKSGGKSPEIRRVLAKLKVLHRQLRQLFNLVIIGLFLSFTGCAAQSPNNQPFAVTAKSDIQNALKYNLIQTGASVACSSVLSLAVNQTDRVDVAGDIYAIGSVIDGLTGGGDVTPEQLQKAISVVSPKSTEFSVLATTFQGLYAGIYPNLNGDAQLTAQVLHQLAAGADNAALVYLAITPTPPTTVATPKP
jgi:hypothetical protein